MLAHLCLKVWGQFLVSNVGFHDILCIADIEVRWINSNSWALRGLLSWYFHVLYFWSQATMVTPSRARIFSLSWDGTFTYSIVKL